MIEWECETCESFETLPSEKTWGMCCKANSQGSYFKTYDSKPLRVHKNHYCQEHFLNQELVAKNSEYERECMDE